MTNDFYTWTNKKSQIDSSDKKPPFFREGEIWWCSIGKNIGVEVGGKGKLFARPVLVLKKLSPTVFVAIPLTTKIKTGDWYYTFSHRDRVIITNLSQIRMLDHRRFVNRYGEIGPGTFSEIKKKLRKLLNI